VPFTDRFLDSAVIGTIQDVGMARTIVGKHLSANWKRTGFRPPYDIWPLTEESLATAGEQTVRGLLRFVETQVRQYLNEGNQHAV
jgi:hypothetical protein